MISVAPCISRVTSDPLLSWSFRGSSPDEVMVNWSDVRIHFPLIPASTMTYHLFLEKGISSGTFSHSTRSYVTMYHPLSPIPFYVTYSNHPKAPQWLCVVFVMEFVERPWPCEWTHQAHLIHISELSSSFISFQPPTGVGFEFGRNISNKILLYKPTAQNRLLHQPSEMVYIPSWKLTYPIPRHFWRWFSFPQVWYVNSLQVTSSLPHRFGCQIP